MLRTMRALSGTSMPRASSTARTEVRACTVVQTPQIRCAQIQASRGSRPRRMSSIPRNIVPELQASVIAASVQLRLNPQMALNPCHRVHYDACHGHCLLQLPPDPGRLHRRTAAPVPSGLTLVPHALPTACATVAAATAPTTARPISLAGTSTPKPATCGSRS